MYDIAIIGAGVVGALIARELSRFNLSLCLIEKASDVAMGSTKANSAIVHAGFDAQPGSLKALLNVKGSQMMEQVAKELGVKYRKNGSLVIAFTDKDMKIIEELYQRGIKNGVKDLEIIDKKTLKELEPNISNKAIAALYAPTGAIICPYELTIAAVGNAMDNGADLKLEFKVEKIDFVNDHYKIMSQNDLVEAKIVINAAGLFADDIANMIGDYSFKISPRKGEYLLLDKDCGGLVKHTIFRVPSKSGKGILVTPTVDGNLLIGPTAEDVDDKEDTSTTIEGMDKVIHQALEDIAVIPTKSIISSFCGLRAVPDQGDFIIKQSKTNFINVAGIESPGLSAAPAIAHYLVNILKDMGVELVPNDHFNPFREPMHRFKDMSIAEKNNVIARDSKFGKIVCRCEQVSEGEIIKAIHTNPKAYNLDAVKRRTRTGMGRCQGGFCTSYIVKILSRELNIAIEEVTKFGGNSNIIQGRTK